MKYATICLFFSNFISQATDIIVTGSSAGGAGSFYHTDYIANLFPGVNVVGAPMVRNTKGTNILIVIRLLGLLRVHHGHHS